MRGIAITCATVLLCCASYSIGQVAQQTQKSSASQTKGTSPQVAAAVQRALTLEQQAKLAEAEGAWESVVKLEPRNAQAYAHMGLLEARRERYAEAIVFYRKAQLLAQAENRPIAQLNLNLGLALFKSGHFDEAAQLFKDELRKNPDSGNTEKLATLTAMSLYGAHQYGASIPYLKDAVAADPKNLTLLLTLAHCYLWTKQLDATLEVYRQILTIDPDSAEADMIAGEALDEKGDSESAVVQFRAAVKANPKEPNVHFGLAYLLWTQKKYDEAIPEFKAELANDPKNNQAMIYLGDTYIQQDQFDQGRAILEEADKYQTTNPLIHLDLGIALMETGNKAGAMREFTKTVSLEPDNVTAHFRLGTLYRSMGKMDEAKTEFAKANTLNRKHDDSLHKRIADANAHSDARPDESQKPDAAAMPDAVAKPEQP